jgi:hypothetical protein
MIKLKLIGLFLILVSFALKVDGQTLVIKSIDGTENNKTLSSLKKFSFENNNLLLRYTDGSTESFSIPAINKLYFESVPVGNNLILSNSDNTGVSVYPNPAKNVLYLKNISDQNSTLLIYRIDGVLMNRIQISSDNNNVDVSKLKSGLYLLKLNKQTIKFIKQ